MTITPQRLDELSEGLVCLVPRPGVGGITSHEKTNNICDCEKLELIRLARMGLTFQKGIDAIGGYEPFDHILRLSEWAEQHAIAALECISTNDYAYIPNYSHEEQAKAALAALPPQAKE